MVKNLKLLRTRAGISQQQLADIIGVSQQSINKYENHNIEPDISTLINLSNYFNTSVDYLVGHSDIDHLIEPVSHYDLNCDETFLIDEYRKLNHSEKDSIKAVIENYNRAKLKPDIH